MFKDEMKYSNPSFGIKLLTTAERLAGKKVRLTRSSHKINLNITDLIEKVLLSILEDIDDQELTPTGELIDIAILLE